MEWTFTDGGGIAPDNAQNRPGDFFVFGWSLYRGTLTLTPVPGAISPLNFRGKPWHRISTTPSAKYFSQRCPPPADCARLIHVSLPGTGGPGQRQVDRQPGAHAGGLSTDRPPPSAANRSASPRSPEPPPTRAPPMAPVVPDLQMQAAVLLPDPDPCMRGPGVSRRCSPALPNRRSTRPSPRWPGNDRAGR